MNNTKRVSVVTIMLMYVSSALCGSLAKNLKHINNLSPHIVSAVEHPHLKEGLTRKATKPLHLKLYYEEPNRIVDEEEWFDQYAFAYPEKITTPSGDIPSSTRFGELKFLRAHQHTSYAVYETSFPLKEPKGIYDEGHQYTLIVFNGDNDSLVGFSLDALFPDILEMCWFDAVGDLVYFNAAYNGYADVRNSKTGYLYCLDIDDLTIRWATKNLISSYRGFTVYKDHILTGYGFTAEPDFLYVVDRFNGAVIQTIPIKTAHEHIIIKHEKCYVRTYNMNYIFMIKE